MTRNARRRIEAAKHQREQAQRDAAYRLKCERDGMTPEQQRRECALGTLADVAAAFSLVGVRRVYG